MWWMVAAMAVEPTVSVDDQHVVTGTVRVASAPEVVRPRLGDAVWLAKVGSSGTRVTRVGASGGCTLYDNVSPNAFKTVRYRTKRCPVEDGWRVELVESDAFTAYEAQWKVVAAGEGAEIRYRLDFDTDMMVPQWVIDRTTKKEVTSMLRNLAGAF